MPQFPQEDALPPPGLLSSGEIDPDDNQSATTAGIKEGANDDMDDHRSGGGDNIRYYLNDIGTTPLLTAEEELELAKNVEAGLYAEEKLRAAEEENIPLSESLAKDLAWIASDGERSKAHLIRQIYALLSLSPNGTRAKESPF